MAEYDAIVLGAGAAGLYCAAHAAQRGLSVLLIDHSDRPGRKILISGGGRCNFTNLQGDRPERYLSENPHFAKSALRRHRPQAFIDLVDRHAIAWHEKTLGQLFCDGSARQIVDLLVSLCRQGTAGGAVEFALGKRLGTVSRGPDLFDITYGETESASAPALVVATGGPAIPKIGATGFAYDLARQFAVPVVPPRPALVPLVLAEAEQDFGGLTGLSASVMARCGKHAFREAALFTHRGLSGPAILQISSYWRPGDAILLDFLPDEPADWLIARKRETPRALVSNALQSALPARLAKLLADRLDAADQPGRAQEFANRADKDLRRLEQHLRGWPFEPSGTAGFAKAEVTAGGVSTAALSSRTLEAQAVPGLYFIGECVDVTGWLGGYNFQWAWSSAWACAEALSARKSP